MALHSAASAYGQRARVLGMPAHPVLPGHCVHSARDRRPLSLVTGKLTISMRKMTGRLYSTVNAGTTRRAQAFLTTPTSIHVTANTRSYF